MREVCGISPSYKDPSGLGQGPTLMTSLYLSYLQEGPSSKCSHAVGELQRVGLEGGGDTMQSLTPRVCFKLAFEGATTELLMPFLRAFTCVT